MGFRVKANEHNLHALCVFMHFANGDFRGTLGWEPINSGADCLARMWSTEKFENRPLGPTISSFLRVGMP
jgi:hypothetical protein